MLKTEVRDNGRHVRAEPEEPGRLDRVRRDDFRRGCALRAAVQRDQEKGRRRRVLPLRLPHPPDRQHAPYTILVGNSVPARGTICRMCLIFTHYLVIYLNILVHNILTCF